MRRHLLVPAALAATLCALACGREPAETASPPTPPPLDTVDVAPPPDAHIDTSLDVQEKRRAEKFSGVLPSGFPSGLPVPPHASLIDQGSGPGGNWVEVLIPRAPDAVRGPYREQLRKAGWEVSDAGDGWRLVRNGRTVGARLQASGPSTSVRLTY